MIMLSCVWYVMFKNAWEISVLGCLAGELSRSGVQLTIYTDGGTEGFENAHSWGSLRPFEKAVIVGGKSKLWHLWEGEGCTIPSWWSFVRFRARTMHTKLENSGAWRGHPSLFCRAQAKGGESIIPPAFEMMVEGGTNWLKADDEITLEGGGASQAFLGAFASLNGVKVIAEESEVLDEMLGKDGYLRIGYESDRNPSGAARRHIQEKFSPIESAKKLMTIYRTMLGVPGV